MTKKCEYPGCELRAKYSKIGDIYPKFCINHFIYDNIKTSNNYCNNCYNFLRGDICVYCNFRKSKL
jgi:hypothetical protein